MIIAVAGALLLSWRIGGAIGAEISHDSGGTGSGSLLIIWSLFAVCAAMPGLMAWVVVDNFQRPDPANGRRLAIAAAVGLYFVVPAVLHGLGGRPSAAPSFGWAVVAFLVYRFFFRPATLAKLPQNA